MLGLIPVKCFGFNGGCIWVWIRVCWLYLKKAAIRQEAKDLSRALFCSIFFKRRTSYDDGLYSSSESEDDILWYSLVC